MESENEEIINDNSYTGLLFTGRRIGNRVPDDGSRLDIRATSRRSPFVPRYKVVAIVSRARSDKVGYG